MTKEQYEQCQKDKINRALYSIKNNGSLPRDLEVEKLVLDFIYDNQEQGGTDIKGLLEYANNSIKSEELKSAIQELTMLGDIELYRNNYWVLTEQSMKKYKITENISGHKMNLETLT